MKYQKILLFIDVLGSGGAQRQLVELAKLLRIQGHDVFLLDYWDSDFYDSYLLQQRIRFEHCPTKGKWNIIRMFMRKVQTFKPNVVISYLENPSIVAVIGRLCTRQKFRLIVSERNTTQHNSWQTKLRMNLFRFADFIVPNSHSQQAFIDKYYHFLRKKVVTITNMVDTTRFVPMQHKELTLPIKFVVVGRVVEQKNPLRFIEAIKKVRDAGYQLRVDWYGDPYPQSYYEQCQALVKRLGLQDYFQFHPATQDVVSVYHAGDVFVLPSIYEGFPNVLCEAMACGLPVIASNVCDNPYIMRDEVNGFLIDPLSVQDMSEKIRFMLELSVEDRFNMGKQSLEIVRSAFSAAQYQEAYIQLIL